MNDASVVLDYFEGLGSVSGYYVPEGEGGHPSRWMKRYWDEDFESELEFDLTQHQFSGVSTKITINRIGDGRLRDDKVDKNFKRMMPKIQDYRNDLIKKLAPLIK